MGDIPTIGRLPVAADAPLEVCGLTHASRNVTENAAQLARQEGIIVYTIGFGAQLDSIEPPGPGTLCGLGNEDKGSSILRRLANVPNTNSENPFHVANEPSGLYCHAIVSSDLQACFDQISSDILRLTM